MELVVITGMSGAGKAAAAKAFEDMAFVVVDNLPPTLLPALVAEPPGERLAVVTDARAGAAFAGLSAALDDVRAAGVKPVILFLDADDQTLTRRFSESRRPHPVAADGGILDSLTAERTLLESVRAQADKTLDTSNLSLTKLRNALQTDFGPALDRNGGPTITLTSFGFKHGLPLDADLVFDVRFLANPHYVAALKPCDGRDPEVKEYVLADPDSTPFLEKLFDFVGWSLPHYAAEGKAYLTVAIGCTGGRHRSVVISEQLAGFLRTRGYAVRVQHRDVEKSNQ